MMSAGPNSRTPCMPSTLARRLRWVSGTTFGVRSLPLVNRMTAWSSSPAAPNDWQMRSADRPARSAPANLATAEIEAAMSSMKTMPSTTGHLIFSSSLRDVTIVPKPSRRCASWQFWAAPVE